MGSSAQGKARSCHILYMGRISELEIRACDTALTAAMENAGQHTEQEPAM